MSTLPLLRHLGLAVALTACLAGSAVPASAAPGPFPETPRSATTAERTHASVLSAAVPPERFTVAGSGWGHGVGLSQYGAAALARQGRSVIWILGHYYYPASSVYSSSRIAQSLRVHVKDTASTVLDGTARIRVRGVGTTSGTISLRASGDRVLVTLPGWSAVSLQRAAVEWEGTRYWRGPASTLRVPAANGTGPLDLRHGRVEVTARDGRLRIVTVLRLTDEYLYGLAEMPSSWPTSALRAQAAAGRTYALRSSATVKSSCDCHVWDEVRSQKFTGWAKESERSGGVDWGARWRSAVNSTVRRATDGSPRTALSVWSAGAPIEALYYSSSGGYTRSNQTVFAAPALSYLQARPDPYSVTTAAANPNRRWSTTVTQSQMHRAFGLTAIVRVTIARDADGVPQRATARTSSGQTRTITTTALRHALGIRSAWVLTVTAQ